MDTGEFYDIAFGDHPDYDTIREEEVVDTSRWSNFMSMVVQEKSTGKYFKVNWEVGATEYQECDPNPIFTEVFPKEITTTIYTTKKED